MKKILCCIAYLLIVLLLNSCATLSPPEKRYDAVQQLRDSLDAILADSLFIRSQFGIKVVSLNDRKILYDRDSKKLFHPASNLKLITTVTALRALGRGFQFKTAFYVDSISGNGENAKNLYIKGFGNPNFTSANLSWMAGRLKASGIRTVIGDLIADISYFDSLYWGKGWMWDDEPSADEAFVSPLSINQNAVRVIVTAGNRAGEPLRVQLVPTSSFFTVENTGITGTDTSAKTLEVTKSIASRSNTIVIRGTLPKASQSSEHLISVWRPELYGLALLRDELQKEGISAQGVSRGGFVSDNANEVVVHQWPLDSVIAYINQPSDNLSAENTLKVIGAEKVGKPGTSLKGISIAKEYLQSLGIDTTTINMADGSGVSHYSLLSADAVVKLLEGVWSDRRLFDGFYNSLSVAGGEGTLKRRMIGTVAAGNVRAKTGTLTGVSNLSGYVTTKDGDLLAVAIMMQHFVGTAEPYRNLQDKIVELLARFTRR